MTLDEAIERAEEVADTKLQDAELSEIQGCYNNAKKCSACAEEHRQLAKWLRELKAYREAHEEIRKLPIVWEFGEGVSRCLTIIENCLKEVNADDSN